MSAASPFSILQLSALADLDPVGQRTDLTHARLKGARFETRAASRLKCRSPSGLEGQQPAERFFFGGKRFAEFNADFPISPAYLALLPHAQVVGPGHVLVSGANQVLQDSYSGDHILQMGGHFQKQNLKIQIEGRQQSVPFVLRRNVRPPRHVADPALLLTQYWHFNYHHWLNECLPRLRILFDEMGDGPLAEAPVIVPADLSSFQRQSLLALGLPESRWLPYDQRPLEIEQLYVPSLGVFAPDELHWLRDSLRRPRTEDRRDRLIYISRQDTTNRQLLNETVIADWLVGQGFEAHTLAGMSFAALLDLFADARLIIGPHGAGLTNMIFAPDDASLIELMPDDQVNHVFWLMANGLGLEYRFLAGRTHNSARDFEISLDAVKRQLDDIEL